jgi:hypothetical protein
MRMTKVLAFFMTIVMVFCCIPIIPVAEAASETFKDMPHEGHWSAAALKSAVNNNLLNGFKEADGIYIKPDAPLTRAQMAAIANRAFGAQKKAPLTGVKDVDANAWYAEDLQKAVYMGTMKLDTYMRPNDNITRQEAFTILARAFKMTDGTVDDLSGFADNNLVAGWAVPGVGALVKNGYVKGDGNLLAPEDNITRAQFAVVMDNMIKQYITRAGIVTSVVPGNVMVNVPGVTLKDATVSGDLIIGDGVGDEDVILENVTVTGNLVIRGGGENSVIIKGGGVGGKVVVAKVDGKVRVSVEEGADIEVVVINDGKDDVIIEGTIGMVEVAAPEVPVVVQNGTVGKIEVTGEGGASITVAGDAAVNDVVVGSNASGTTLNVEGRVAKVETSAVSTIVSGTGTVNTVTVKEGADNTAVTTPSTKVNNEGASGVTAGGGAEVPPNSSATNDDKGADIVTKPPSSGGGGGSGGSGSVAVSAISITTVPAPDVDGKYANDATVTVTLDTTTSGATIYYTLDGTTPTSGSTKYTEPFTVEAPGDEGGPVIVKAIGMRSGYTNSAVATKTITFRTAAVPVDKEITSVASIADISVAYGTELSAVGLPTTVEVTLDDETTRNLSVTWDGGTPAYDGNTAGEYVFAGTLTLVEGLANTGGHKAQIKVIVAEAVPVDKEITSVASIADISVAYGTELSAVGLPTTVEVTLDDETTRNLSVTWDGGTPAYDGNTAGEYVFAGTLTLVEGLANTGGHKAQIKVIVAEAVPVDKEITSVASIADISVAYGTELSAVGLPTTVEVTLDDETTRNLSVTWDGGTPAYDGNTAGEYVFAGTLTLVEGLANTGGHKAQIKVIVAEAVPVDKEITSVASIADISVAYGTELSAVGLPTTVEVTLDDETTRNLSVTWDGGTPAYDGNTAGEYVFAGTLTLVEGLANTGGHKAQIKVIVAEAVPVDKEITSVASIADISVAYGTELSAVGLPTTVEVTLDDETTRNLSVTWDGGTPAYDGNTAGEYVFAGTLTLVEGLANTGGHKAQIKVIVAEAVPVDKEITSVASIADISVAYGTELSAVGLPTTVEVTLDDETTRNLSVTWDGGTPAYDGNTAGEYVFAGTLTLVEGLANTGGHKAQIKVIVAEAVPVDKEITSVASIADISVAYGTELSAVGLPTTVEVTLDDETTRNLSVTWDGGTPAYDGNTAGEYVFAGTLTLVEGLANTGGHKAQIKVIVAEAVPVDKEITSVASIADISVAYGTELSAVGLPTTVEVTLDDETTRNLSVTWDGGTPAYDGNTAGEYVFAGTLTLVEGLANTGGHKAQIKVIVAEAVPVDKEITSVASIADISVAYGTELSAVGLPTTVEVTLDDETTRNLSVTWDGGTPAYDGNTAGEYVFAGTLTLVEGLANTGGHKAQIKVIVAEAVPVDKEITSVASIADISVAYGTELSAVGLPTTVEVTLDDETTRNLSVTWDGGTPAYDGNTAGEYVFAGTLTLVEGLANTGGHKAQIKVIVAEAVPVDKEITSVASIADISVAYGTELSAVGLPTTVEVTLDDETTRNLSVTWDGGTPAYDGNTAGEYVFAGTLTLVEGLANTGGHKAQIKVIVAEAVPVDKEITSVASIADISVAYGTELSAVGLPTTVEVTLDDETTRNLSVTWDGGTPAYDGNTAGEYVFAGTLTLVEGLANTGGHKAQIKVIVAEAVPVDKEITSVASIADISVAYGTELSAVGLPTTVEVTLDDETTRNLSVTWDGGTPAYDGNTAGEYVFAGTLTLVEGLANTGGHKAQIKVIVAEAVPVDKEITSVASIADISVAYGTELSAVGLPTTVEVTLDDETTRNLSVTWDGGTPAYDGNTAGEYVFAGTLTLVEGLANTGGHKAQIKVIVAEAVPVDKEITSVASIADISVAYGTELSAVGLPTTVEVTLDDETTRNLSVTWDGGTPAYDGNTAGEYVFAGTLTLVEGLANTGGHKAQIKVIVAEAVPVDKEITSVASIADISVAYGTELSAVGLPTTVEVTLDDETTRNLSVTWDGGTPAYDGNTAGEYVFAGTLTLVEGLANTGGHKAQIKVIVAEAVPVDKEITSVASIADISVAYGTELSAVGLPTTVEVTLDDETTRNLSVTWDGGTPAYDGNTAGEYVFAGTLTLVEGLANTGGHKAQIKVIVAEAVPVKYTLTLTGENITSDPEAGPIVAGTSVTITVTPAEGMRVATFTVNDIDKKAELTTENKYTFTIDADTIVAVTYETIPVVAALAAVNVAEDKAAMKEALEEHADILDLDLEGDYAALSENRQLSVADFVLDNRAIQDEEKFAAVEDIKAAFEAGVAYQAAIGAFAQAVNSEAGLTEADAIAMRDAYEAMGEFQNVSEDPQLVQVIELLEAFIELDETDQKTVADSLLDKIEEIEGSSWNRTDILTALNMLVEEMKTEEAKAAFLGALADKAEAITVAQVEIDDEDISVTFLSSAKISEVYDVAEELLDTFKEELEAAELTIILGEDEEKTFNLEDADVVDIARYLLGDLSPTDFLDGEQTIEASYRAEATVEGVTFSLAGSLKFQAIADPAVAAKADFLAALKDKAKDITVAQVEIDDEDISVTFLSSAEISEVYNVAEELLDTFKEELEAAELTIILGEDEEKTFNLEDADVVDIARYLLGDLSPTDFLDGEQTIEASYRAEATVEGVTFSLAGSLKFQAIADPAIAAKAAFLGALADKAEAITVAQVEIDDEDISVTFLSSAKISEVYDVAEELLDTFKEELEAAELIIILGEDEEKTFNLEDADVVDIARYLLGDLSPTDFLDGEQTIEASYRATATVEGVTFSLAGSLKFQAIADPAIAAKAAFLGALAEKAEAITVAQVEIDDEDISVTFLSSAEISEVYDVAEELLDTFKEELEAAELTIILGEDEEKTFNLEDADVVDIARYLLGDLSPTDFLDGEQTIEASYRATATVEGVTFSLAGSLKFQAIADPAVAAKADFLAALKDKAKDITVAQVEIDDEDISVTFLSSAKISEVYDVAEELLDTFKEELEAAELTIILGEDEEETFNLEDADVVDIARYLLDDLSPTDFLAGEQTIEASYRAEATVEGVTFSLAGSLKFQAIADPAVAAKADFLAALKDKAKDITVAQVEIDDEDISVTFLSSAEISEVYDVAEELLDTFKEELEAAELTIILGEDEEETFNLEDADVVDIALYLLDDLSPGDFLAGEQTIEASYRATATVEGVTFSLAGSLKFQAIADPAVAAKADFLAALKDKAKDITVAQVEIDDEDISVTFLSSAKISEVYDVAEELLDTFKEELEAAELTIILGEDEEEDLQLRRCRCS